MLGVMGTGGHLRWMISVQRGSRLFCMVGKMFESVCAEEIKCARGHALQLRCGRCQTRAGDIFSAGESSVPGSVDPLGVCRLGI